MREAVRAFTRVRALDKERARMGQMLRMQARHSRCCSLLSTHG